MWVRIMVNTAMETSNSWGYCGARAYRNGEQVYQPNSQGQTNQQGFCFGYLYLPYDDPTGSGMYVNANDSFVFNEYYNSDSPAKLLRVTNNEWSAQTYIRIVERPAPKTGQVTNPP
jgi:hypothetical protein